MSTWSTIVVLKTFLSNDLQVAAAWHSLAETCARLPTPRGSALGDDGTEEKWEVYTYKTLPSFASKT